jgi:Ni/Co efflux regulator RcnB
MKLSIVTVILLASLVQSASAQSNASAPNRNHAAESKQAKEEQKAKVRAQKETAKKPAADNGKKTTSTQDAAYAAAYKAGIPR